VKLNVEAPRFSKVLGSPPVSLAAFVALGEEKLDVYISVFTIEYLALVEVLRPRRKLLTPLRLDPVGLGLFIIFCLIVARKVMEILTG